MFTDRVMGGVSNGTMVHETVEGRPAIRMRDDVSLENNGGFVQIALDLAPDGRAVDVSAWSGLELDVLGNGEEYSVHLRTSDVARPWQSYRQSFRADPQWRTAYFRFEEFVPYRTDVPLNIQRLRRIGVGAIGRAFSRLEFPGEASRFAGATENRSGVVSAERRGGIIKLCRRDRTAATPSPRYAAATFLEAISLKLCSDGSSLAVRPV